MTIETPPTWAIEEALKRAECEGWVVADVLGSPRNPYAKTILAYATTIAKYEQPPVDPVAQVLADYWKALGLALMADDLREGARNYAIDVTALRTALEKHGLLKGPTQ